MKEEKQKKGLFTNPNSHVHIRKDNILGLDSVIDMFVVEERILVELYCCLSIGIDRRRVVWVQNRGILRTNPKSLYQ
jgi:hypothetical protein